MADKPAAAGSGRAPSGAGPGLIRRHGLVAALARAAQKRVTIISAPAGTGKTSLLRTWASEPGRDCRVAFMTVRPGQHDMQLFWLTMLGAVRAAAGRSDADSRAVSAWWAATESGSTRSTRCQLLHAASGRWLFKWFQPS